MIFDFVPVLFFLAIVAVIVGVVVQFQLKQRRREEWAQEGLKLGLDFSHQDPFGLVHLPFTLFRKGAGQGVENVLSGQVDGRDLKAFDFWYYTESTDDKGQRRRSYRRFTCVLTEIPATCPPLQITKETIVSRLGAALGFRDIEFESEQFNRRFRVTGSDPKFAHDLIDPRMMEWLLSGGGDHSFELRERWVLCYTPRIPPRALRSMVLVVDGFHRRIPGVVWELYGAKGR